MKHFIEVTRHVAGRTITQRYPARRVGEQQPGVLGAVDFTCLDCGYVECACPGGGWPPPIATEPPETFRVTARVRSVNRDPQAPPADVLPEGWTLQLSVFDAVQYQHRTGANVWLCHGEHLWRWTASHEIRCDDSRRKPTRDEAMAAALASVQPAEPALRPGWTVHGLRNHAPDYWLSSVNALHMVNVFRVDYGDDAPWRVIAVGHYDEPNLPTVEAAMLRAEELVRGQS